MVAFTRVLAVVAALLAAPTVAAGQTANPVRVSSGQRVFVTLTTGLETTGKVDHVTNTTIVIATDRGLQAIDLATVKRIEKRDSVKNGALVGGILTGGYLSIAAAQDGQRSEIVWAGLIVGGAYGVISGALMDLKIKHRDVVWEPPPRLALTLSPVATRHTLGVAGKVVW